jgi:hypothetical protein
MSIGSAGEDGDGNVRIIEGKSSMKNADMMLLRLFEVGVKQLSFA